MNAEILRNGPPNQGIYETAFREVEQVVTFLFDSGGAQVSESDLSKMLKTKSDLALAWLVTGGVGFAANEFLRRIKANKITQFQALTEAMIPTSYSRKINMDNRVFVEAAMLSYKMAPGVSQEVIAHSTARLIENVEQSKRGALVVLLSQRADIDEVLIQAQARLLPPDHFAYYLSTVRKEAKAFRKSF